MVSTPLPELKGLRLSVPVPQGWRIAKRDPEHNWVYTSYTFDLDRLTTTRRATAPLKLAIEVLRYSMGRARQNDLLVGEPIQVGGRRALYFDDAEWEVEGDYTVYLVMPLPETVSALIVRVMYHGKSKRDVVLAEHSVHRLADRILKGVRFVR